MNSPQALLGIAAFIGLCWSLSENRSVVSWRTVGVGLVIQLALAFAFLKVPMLTKLLLALNYAVTAVEQATFAGTQFVFGYLGGAPPPFAVDDPAAEYVFAFRVLPQIIVFSVLVALLWHWRILPMVVGFLGRVLERVLGIGGAVGTAAASSVLLGMVETPLVIRAYLERLSRSELFTVMTCGMATVAGSIMVLYANVLRDSVPGALGHVIAASFINMIGAIYVSRILVPPDASDEPTSQGDQMLRYATNMDAVARGTTDGLKLAVNVAAMLVVLLSLVALVNQALALLPGAAGALTLQQLLGWLFAPVAWLMGIDWAEAAIAGSLLGTKLVLNELVAFINLSQIPGDTISTHTRLILTYALCGFANFGSIGILVAGLCTLAPQQKENVLDLAFKSLLSGTIVAFLTGSAIALTNI